MGVVLVLHGQGILADMEDGHVQLAVDHTLAREDGCFVLGWGVVGWPTFPPANCAGGARE